MIAGSMVVNPDGEIVAGAMTEDDELIVADVDLDATAFGKKTIFDFARHRRIEHYGIRRAPSCHRSEHVVTRGNGQNSSRLDAAVPVGADAHVANLDAGQQARE
jgi:hypothetical protein